MPGAPTDANLLDILRVCQEERAKGFEMFDGQWIRVECQRRGIPFHQSKLGKLVRMGWLEKAHSTRGGNRRYYRVINADPVKPTRAP